MSERCWSRLRGGGGGGGENHYFSTQGTGLVGSFDFAVEGAALLFAVAAAALRAATSKKEAITEGWDRNGYRYIQMDIYMRVCVNMRVIDGYTYMCGCEYEGRRVWIERAKCAKPQYHFQTFNPYIPTHINTPQLPPPPPTKQKNPLSWPYSAPSFLMIQ